MAKIRRTLRKVPQQVGTFDEQFWPVMIALFVLGGFLVGTALAYLQFDDARWYANAWIWILLISAWTCAMIWVLRHVHNRLIRRGVQFSAAVCLTMHAILLVICVETHLFGKPWEQTRATTERRQRQPVVVPQYEEVQLRPERHRQQSYMRPVETETPETEMEQFEPELQEVQPPTETQPAPTPEREVTVRPQLIPRPTPAETVPRQAEQMSQLRRSISDSQMPATQPVNATEAAPEPATQSSTLASQDSQLQQRRSASAAIRTPEIPDAPTNAVLPTLARSRRTEQTAPDNQAAAAPTMQRSTNDVRELPRTQVDANVAPAVARQTQPTELQPANTLSRSANTTAPPAERSPAEPNVAMSTPTEPTAQRREQQTEPRPTVAQSPVPVPNQRTRSTERPDVATVATEVNPSSTPGQSPAVAAAEGAITRNATASQAMRQPTSAEPAANPNTVAASNAARRATEQMPNAAAQPNPAPVVRQTSNNNLAASTAAVEQSGAQAAASQTAAVAPTASAPSRQAVTSPQVARAEGNPTAQAGPNGSPSIGLSNATRQNATGSAPDVTSPSATAVATRSASSAQPNAAVTASTVESNVAANSTAGVASVAAATGGVGRQTTSTNATGNDQPSSGGPQLSPSAQIVSGSRAQPANAASIDPQAPATASPTRSVRAVELAASPANIESPAMAQGTPGTSAPAPDASRNALTRSLNGVAGVGQSTNLDRALTAGESPALVASGAARRAETTQNTPAGPALAPSAPALVRSSLAGADRPTASLQANTLAMATEAGSESPSAQASSSSAALTRADSNANPGLISASAGQVQVDLGPTRVVSENGASRAAGGGQPELNLASQSQQLTRNTANAAENSALASMNVAAEPAAPPGTGGGEPTPQGLAPRLADVGRGEPNTVEVAAGGAMAGPTGAVADQPAGNTVVATTISRATGDASQPEVAAAAGGSTAGDEETEEERARRLARQSLGGAPQLATTADLAPGSAEPTAGGASTPGAFEPTATGSITIARTESAGGGAVSGESLEPVMDAAAATGGGDMAGPNVVRRAEAADGLAGNPEPGGGTALPARSAPAQSLAANLESTVAMLAGAPESGGVPTGSNVDTLGIDAAPLTGGVQSTPSSVAVGADMGSEMIVGTADGGTLSGLAAQTRSTAGDDGPALGNDVASESALRRSSSSTLALSTSAAGPVGVPTAPSSTALASTDAANAGLGSDLTPMTRQSGIAMSLDVDAIDGPPGLGTEPAAELGQNTRRSRPESLQIQASEVRFVRTDIGGLPNFSTGAVIASEAFRGRGTREMGGTPGGGLPLPGSDIDKAVELGLVYLVKQQLPDGSWSLQAADKDAALVSDTAATGLALLAFQGYGYTHHQNKYADNVRRGLDYLLKNQKPNGDLFVPTDDVSNQSVWLYSHGIAALALCEAYGMTQDPALRDPAQRCVNFIVASQHPDRGGWRYQPNEESDTSVTGWMMMALKSAQLANLDVPTETFAKIEHWLDLSQGSREERHLYRYNPHAINNEEQRHGRRVSTTMTSVGLLMRLYTGWKRDNENMIRGAEYLLENPPAIGTAVNPKRDTYYWYYATQVMFHMGGKRWEQWNKALHPVLVDTQVRSGALAGSWEPRGPVADKWAPHAGRLYVTTLNLLSLEVHYRHLPLYEETAK